MFKSSNEQMVDFSFQSYSDSDLRTVQILNNITSNYLGTPDPVVSLGCLQYILYCTFIPHSYTPPSPQKYQALF